MSQFKAVTVQGQDLQNKNWQDKDFQHQDIPDHILPPKNEDTMHESQISQFEIQQEPMLDVLYPRIIAMPQADAQQEPMPGVFDNRTIAALLNPEFNNDDHVVVSLGTPIRALQILTYTPAKTVFFYDALTVVANAESFKSAVGAQSMWLYMQLYSGLCCLHGVKSTQNVKSWGGIAIESMVVRRLKHAWENEPWIENFLRSRDLSDSVKNHLHRICNAVSSWNDIREFLSNLCCQVLLQRYDERVDLEDPIVFENFKASCWVEARRWYLRIIRGWAFEVWQDLANRSS